MDGDQRQLPGLETYADLAQPAVSPDGRLALLASGPRVTDRLVTYDPATGQHAVVARSSGETIDFQWLSEPKPITWVSTDGESAHGLFYAPAPKLSSSGQPPLIVRVHGGPTSQSDMSFASQVQFFASRGYAVLDVNYRGSTGYGRAYMLALREQWGLRDVQDTVSGAQHLAAQGLVDPQRMVIMGGSAGGYTVLQTLIHHPGVFKAGICLYGVSNLFTLASDTHKFEARYLDSMIGPLPETADRYRERSPIFGAERIKDPIAVFQGDQDQVVPLDQAETVVAALRRSGTPHEYHVFAGEGHGWRKAETVASFYELVLRFLKQYVLFA
jgi:dipeptidyl aminopeptidase/acylaminoacyl peptidase